MPETFLIGLSGSISSSLPPAVYRDNEFQFNDADRAWAWIQQMSANMNIQHLTKVRIFVDAVYTPSSLGYLFLPPSCSNRGSTWRKILDMLAAEAEELQELWIYWD